VEKQGRSLSKDRSRSDKPLTHRIMDPAGPFALATMSGMGLLVRDFRADDFETLWRIDQECFPPGISYSRQELKLYIRRRGTLTIVADSEGEIAGFIVAHNGPTGHVITIDVVGKARRSGVGSLLLEAAETRLQAAGSRSVGLETAVDNVGALSFYKRHGYSVVGTCSRYYSNGVDALVMRKELPVRDKGAELRPIDQS